MAFQYKTAYTTSEAARVCAMSAAKLKRLFDKGVIEGYVLPDSRDRRIPPDKLIKFMKQYDIPIPVGLNSCTDSNEVRATLARIADELNDYNSSDRTAMLFMRQWARELRDLC